MNHKVVTWFNWVKHRPVAIINITGIAIIIFGLGGYLLYESVRPLDVLVDFSISVSMPKETRIVDGIQYAIYHPGDSFVFTSKATKLIDITGNASRMIVCEETSTQRRREIQLDNIAAVRPSGKLTPSDNAVVIPDVTQFEKLPRYCRLVINVTYDNISLNRSLSEHAETETFIVEDLVFDAKSLSDQISKLKLQLQELEAQANKASGL